LRGALAAMAHIRRAGARDGHPDGRDDPRYSVHHLFDLGDEDLAHYLAALLMLGHADAVTAREILEVRDAYALIDRAEGVARRMRELLQRGGPRAS
jgi:hypothetical protein